MEGACRKKKSVGPSVIFREQCREEFEQKYPEIKLEAAFQTAGGTTAANEFKHFIMTLGSLGGELFWVVCGSFIDVFLGCGLFSLLSPH